MSDITRDAAEDLASFAARAPVSTASARAAVLNDLIDTLACAAAGCNADGTAQMRSLLADWSGKPEANIWFDNLAVPGPWAALHNGLASHAVEFDDTHDEAILHAGITVIPAVAAAAERRGHLEGEEFVAAIAVGIDVACRLALATNTGPGETGWLLTPLCGTFGAAAGAARALGLDTGKTLHALGLAYAQAAGNGQATIDGALAKRLQPGLAAKAGTLAAIMASAGITGARQVFEGKRGFFAVYQRGDYDRNRVTDRLGEIFAVESLSFKPYPCCRWTHAALEAALAARRSGVEAGAIDSIQVLVNRQAFNSTGDPIAVKRRPRNVVDSQFSIPFAVAAAIVDGHVGLEHFTPDAIERGDLLQMAARVSVAVGDEWTGELARSVSPARLRICMRDGSKTEQTVVRPTGSSGEAGTDRILRTKFVRCCTGAGLSGGDSEARLERLESIGAQDNAVPIFQAATAAIPVKLGNRIC